MSDSPFVVYRSIILGHQPNCKILRDCFMSLFDGDRRTVDLSVIALLPDSEYQIAMSMIATFHAKGHGDREFMALAAAVRKIESVPDLPPRAAIGAHRSAV